jgi:hypothetical protein
VKKPTNSSSKLRSELRKVMTHNKPSHGYKQQAHHEQLDRETRQAEDRSGDSTPRDAAGKPLPPYR